MNRIRLFACFAALNLACFVRSEPALPERTDLVKRPSFARTVAVDLGSGTMSGASAGETILKTPFGLTIESTGNEPVEFRVSGTLAGTLAVKSRAPYALVLCGVSITAAAGPAIDLASPETAFVDTEQGSVNELADSATRDASMRQKGALCCAGSLVLGGSGALSVTGSYRHGILADDSVRVTGGTISVSVSARNGIQAVNAFVIDGGSLEIRATGDAPGDEGRGIKVSGADDAAGERKGYIRVNGGTIDVTSVGKGLSADWDIDKDASKAYRSGNPDPFIEINAGTVRVTTTGKIIKQGSLADHPEASCSPEGIEGKSRVTVNGGSVTVSSADDCLNAGEAIVINGGWIYAASSDNDAIDSNGTITITGGVIVAVGADVPEEAFDSEENEFTIAGGTIVGIAGTTSEPTESGRSQSVVVLGGGKAGTTFALRAKDGTVAFAFAIPRDYGTMVLSSPSIRRGMTYVTVTGAALSGDRIFNGLYLGSLAAAGGTDGAGFMVRSPVTRVDPVMMGPGGFPPTGKRR